MSEVNEIGIRAIPEESKIMMIGDWYKKPGKGWRVVCYLYHDEFKLFKSSFPVDLLPLLIMGSVFPVKPAESQIKGLTGTIKLPEKQVWERKTFKDLPEPLISAKRYLKEFENNAIYKIPIGKKIYWLPKIELARILFFHSSEVVRSAIYEGNALQLGKSYSDNRVGHIELSENIPYKYISSLQYRYFFTWLFFDSKINESFCSIFQTMNSSVIHSAIAERWSFDFLPPDLSHCEISLAGYKSKQAENHFLIREIRSISGLKSPDLDIVYFSHPNDDIFLEQQDNNQTKTNNDPIQPVNIRQLDLDNEPRFRGRHHFINQSRSGINFDGEINTKRKSRKINVRSQTTNSELEEIKETEETASLLRANDIGHGQRAEVDNLNPADPLNSPEKIVFFQTMLQQLEKDYGWKIETMLGNVPRKKCRSQHLVDGRPRRYCHAIIYRDESTIIQMLEIELTYRINKQYKPELETLSTLIFRASNTVATFQGILDELMSSDKDKGIGAMNWKRDYISKNTSVREYLGHPESKIMDDEVAMKSWVDRAAQKVIGM